MLCPRGTSCRDSDKRRRRRSVAKGAARARRAVEKVVDGKPEMIGTDKDFRFVRTLFINV